MDKFTTLAKQAIEEYVINKKIFKIPEDLPSEFYSRRAGIFVTLYKEGELRGCIGTYLPTKKNLAEEIVANAIFACSQDNRFCSVEKDELPALNYEVSVLNEPKRLTDFNKHNPKKQGILVACADGRRGLLLPDLIGIDSLGQQIAIACQKGGINIREENIQVFSFTVEKHI